MEKVLNVKMTEEQHEEVREAAHRLNISMAEFVRRAIDMLLEVTDDIDQHYQTAGDK